LGENIVIESCFGYNDIIICLTNKQDYRMPYFITTKNKAMSVRRHSIHYKSPNPRKRLVATVFEKNKKHSKEIEWNERSGKAINHNYGDLKRLDIVRAERGKHFDNRNGYACVNIT